MKNILRQELIKTWNYTGFRVLLIIHLVLLFGVILVPSGMDITVPGFSTDHLYQFPNVWQFVPWVASWFNILLSLLIIILICNEYNFNTFRQSVINGLNREGIFAGKALVVIALAIYSTLVVVLFSLGFGLAFSHGAGTESVFDHFGIVGVYLVQVIAYMAFAMFFAFLFRNMALSIVLFFVYRLVFEPILRQAFPPAARGYFPMKIITNLTPTPEFISIFSGGQQGSPGPGNFSMREMGLIAPELPQYLTVLLALAYTAILLGACLLLLRKRDL